MRQLHKIHDRVLKQWQVWYLIIAKTDYGIDYYWRDRHGYLFTSSRRYVAWGHYKSFHIKHGFLNDGKHHRFPKWWRDSRLANRLAGDKRSK